MADDSGVPIVKIDSARPIAFRNCAPNPLTSKNHFSPWWKNSWKRFWVWTAFGPKCGLAADDDRRPNCPSGHLQNKEVIHGLLFRASASPLCATGQDVRDLLHPKQERSMRDDAHAMRPRRNDALYL
jgi:hypothetical protein